jgi:hypothetical protein
MAGISSARPAISLLPMHPAFALPRGSGDDMVLAPTLLRCSNPAAAFDIHTSIAARFIFSVAPNLFFTLAILSSRPVSDADLKLNFHLDSNSLPQRNEQPCRWLRLSNGK